jgi:N-acetylglucosaminyldiphosphoundecaprenol N-acetyl-beta-D-mannosaminyltransferase
VLPISNSPSSKTTIVSSARQNNRAPSLDVSIPGGADRAGKHVPADSGDRVAAQCPIEKFSVLGVKVDAVQIPDVNLQMRDWIAQRGRSRYIAVTGMHGVMEAHHSTEFRSVLDDADLVVPDGMPLVWFGRMRGHSFPRRVYGPELMQRFCEQTAGWGYRHFIYGGDADVPDQVAGKLRALCPEIHIVGADSPPFRALTPEEDAAVVQRINNAAPDVLWIGLGTPKQELWMRKHRDLLNVPVMVGVGAAFDFLASRKRQAPVWMQEHGLEWLFRLVQEPRRLWKRYLVGGSEFVFLAALDLLGLRRFD